MIRRTLLAGASASLTLALTPARGAPRAVIDDPPPGKAQIVFYRRLAFAAAAVTYRVREGATDIGDLNIGTYFVVPVDPGLHTYTVHAERHREMQIVAEAGETYFVRFELDTGFLLWQPVLTPSEERLFDEISGGLKRSKPISPSPPPDATQATAAKQP